MTTLINLLTNALKIAQESKIVNTSTDIVIKDEHEIEECFMCLEELDTKSNYLSLCCGHKIHFTCFIKNSELGTNPGKCGYCRQKVVSDELNTEIQETKRQSRIDEERVNQEYIRELRESAIEERRVIMRQRISRRIVNNQNNNQNVVVNNQDVFDNLPTLPVRIPQRPNQNNLARSQRRRGNNNQQLVINALNTEIYLTIDNIVANIRRNGGNLGDGAVRRHVRNLVATRRVHRGQSEGRASNYILNLLHDID